MDTNQLFIYLLEQQEKPLVNAKKGFVTGFTYSVNQILGKHLTAEISFIDSPDPVTIHMYKRPRNKALLIVGNKQVEATSAKIHTLLVDIMDQGRESMLLK